MGKLSIPDFTERQKGEVIIILNVANRIDQVLAERGFISPEEVCSATLTNVLVDTGATMNSEQTYLTIL